MSVGKLVVSLGLDAADYTKGLTKAEQDAQSFADNAKAIGTKIGLALGAGAVAAGSGLILMVKSAIDAADHLNDLSKKTGIAVDTLGGIGFAASQAGGDIESVSAAAGKLNKTLAEAASGNKEAQEAFNALGISVKDIAGNTKSADRAMVEIADKFASFADGPEKAALALRLFGKAGADVIPLLDDGGKSLQENIEYFKRYSGVTKEVADQADQFNDTLGKVALINKSLGTTIAAELLSPLQGLADAFLATKENSDLFGTAASGLRIVLETLIVTGATVKDTFVNVGDAIGAYAAVSARLLQGDIAGAKAIGRAWGEAGDERIKAANAFARSIIKDPSIPQSSYSNEGRNAIAKAGAKLPAPRLSDNTAGAEADAILRKQLDGQLKLIRDFAQQQGEAYKFANRYVEGVYQDGIVSLKEFFDTQQRVRAAGVAAQVKAVDDEIAALQRYSAKAGPKERVDAENKIADAVRRRAMELQKAGQENILSAQEEARATLQLKDRYDDLRATILQLGGDTAAASKIRIDQQVRDAQKLITGAGGDPRQGDALRAGLEGQAALAEAQKQYNRLLEQQRDAEESILIAAKTSGDTELQTLQKLGVSRQEALRQLDEMVDKANELALSSGGNKEALRFAEQLGLQFKRASSEIEPALQKLRDDVQSTLGQGLVDALGGNFKSIGDLFKQMLVRMAAEAAAAQITKAIFGDSKGGAGGLGSIASAIGALLGSGGVVSGSSADSATGATIHGRHAAGLAYVPFDGYRAELHKGERVMTAAENRNSGINVIVNAPPGTQVDRREARDDGKTLELWLSLAEQRVAGGIDSGTGPAAAAMKRRGVSLNGSLPRRS